MTTQRRNESKEKKTHLGDKALVQHKDLVRARNRREAMCDNEHRAALAGCDQRGLDDALGLTAAGESEAQWLEHVLSL